MFSSAIQPSLVSLFSSTGSDPLGLWSSHTDPMLPSDSFICLLNDSSSLPAPAAPAALVSPHPVQPNAEETQKMGYALGQTVLHIQSPSLPTTYVRCPPTGWRSTLGNRAGDLAMKLPWMHIQVRNMGREWAFEVGLVDLSGKEGVVRCSTFQKSPALRPASPPILHLPLSFPLSSSTPLTSWSTIALHLPPLLAHFSSRSLLRRSDDSDRDEAETATNHSVLPSAEFSHVSYVKVYATCRLRRLWFSETGTTGGQKTPWEFLLYAADV